MLLVLETDRPISMSRFNSKAKLGKILTGNICRSFMLLFRTPWPHLKEMHGMGMSRRYWEHMIMTKIVLENEQCQSAWINDIVDASLWSYVAEVFQKLHHRIASHHVIGLALNYFYRPSPPLWVSLEPRGSWDQEVTWNENVSERDCRLAKAIP